MFQTEWMLFLQSFSSGALTFFMKAVTVTGYEEFVIALVLVVILGIDLKRGFLLFQIIVWTGILTEFAKQAFALPRPTWVDSAVRNLESGRPNPTVYTGMGAKDFLQPLPPGVVEAYRLQGGSFGFPSGHVSGAVALWGGLWVLFKQRIWRWALPVLVITMSLSRMYLGRHFLADVLGGALIGGLVLGAAALILARSHGYARMFIGWNPGRWVLPERIWVPALLVGIPLLLPLLSYEKASMIAGYMAGVNGAFLWLMRRVLPPDEGNCLKRAARVMLGAIVFLSISVAMERLMDLPAVGMMRSYAIFLKAAVPGFTSFWIVIPLCWKLGLYASGRGCEDRQEAG